MCLLMGVRIDPQTILSHLLVIAALFLNGTGAQLSNISNTIYYNYPQQICYNDFTTADANAACIELSFVDGSTQYSPISCPSVSFYPASFACTSSDDSLSTCAQV